MINTIITYLNTRLSLTNLFEHNYDLVELVEDGKGQITPKQYCSNGEWMNVSNIDKYNGLSYWRKSGEIAQAEVTTGNVSCDKYLSIEVPLTLVVAVPRSKMIDNNYTSDSIASIITKQLWQSSATLKTNLTARRVNISVASYDTRSEDVFSTEFKNVVPNNIDFKYAYLSLSVNVLVEIKASCIINECADVDDCTNLLASLTASEKITCILPSYNFADTNVLDNLTAQQEIDLIAALCTAAADATVNVNSTLYSVVASGGTLNVPVQNSAATLLGTVNAGVSVVIPDKTFTDSDGSISPLVQGVDYTCQAQIQTVFLKGIWGAGISTLPTLTIDADNAGTYTSESSDGSSGTLTYSINGGGFAAFSNPTVLSVSDTIIAKRTVTTAVGYFKFSGTY